MSTTLICRAANSDLSGQKPASHSPVMGPCGVRQQGPWPIDAAPGPPREPSAASILHAPVFQATICRQEGNFIALLERRGGGSGLGLYKVQL